MRRVELFVGLLLGLCLGGARAEEAAFRYHAPISVQQQAAFIQVPLPASVYGRSLQAGLGDLRVLDARGQRVPFTLLPPRADTSQRSERLLPAALYPLPARPTAGGTWASPVEVIVQGDRISVRQPAVAAAAQRGSPGWLFDLGERAPGAPAPAGLRLAWSGPAEFSAGFVLESSDELRHWRPGGAGQVLSLASAAGALSQPLVPLPAGVGRFVRLLWDDAAEAPQLSAAQAVVERIGATALDAPARLMVMPARAPPDPADAAAQRALVFDLGGVLPLVDLDLELGGGTRVAPVRLQGRSQAGQAWQALGGTVFYQLQRAPDAPLSRSPAWPLQASVRYVRVLPDERAAALDPAQTRLVVHAALASLVFAAQGEPPFTLQAGSLQAAPGALPASTLVPALEQERGRFGRATLGEWREVPAVAQQVAADQRHARLRPWLLWAVLLAGVAGLGFMVWRLARGAARR